uniref:Uncharacterized protein n=1 Tax=Setaria viridis TaxID=4556 RepID=A0A4U6TQG6_SETVI|nr:hypothetical protein SEVIR_7G011600v2 [Setaria viridis]
MAPWAQCCTGMGTWHHGRSAAPSTPRSPARRPQVPHPAAVDHPAWPRLSRTHPAAHKYAPRRCVPSRDREAQRCAPSREEAAAPRCPGTPPVAHRACRPLPLLTPRASCSAIRCSPRSPTPPPSPSIAAADSSPHRSRRQQFASPRLARPTTPLPPTNRRRLLPRPATPQPAPSACFATATDCSAADQQIGFEIQPPAFCQTAAPSACFATAADCSAADQRLGFEIQVFKIGKRNRRLVPGLSECRLLDQAHSRPRKVPVKSFFDRNLSSALYACNHQL